MSFDKISAKNLLPAPFDWCSIPAGKVTLGKEYKRNFNRLDKAYGVGQTFELAPFEIGKYPITNAQYKLFMEAGAYQDKTFWTKAGWKLCRKQGWIEPRYWENTNRHEETLPVMNISWYEAVAFCTWLSAATGDKLTLPTEQQWQRAAQALPNGEDSQWAYVWGDDWDSNKCNNCVRPEFFGQTTPVTHYENLGNKSPCGVVDLIGNTFEWCLTEYETGNISLSGANFRVVRSTLKSRPWFRRAHFYRSTQRYYNYPSARYNFTGFRVCRA